MKKHLFNRAIIAFIAIMILLVISFTLPCLPAQADESYPECWGVFIGVSDYSTNTDLVYADDDARELYEVFSPVWGTSHTQVLIDSVANEAEILNSVAWLAANADINDTVVFTFSGLGVAPGAICPSDFTPARGGLTTTQLADAFASVKAGKILIILDSGYAGKFRTSLTKEGRMLMLSSTVQETSKESSEYKHGIFTYFILQALGDFDAHDTNQNYELSAEEIASYANEMTLQAISNQHPVIDDRIDGELPLLTKCTFALNMSLPAGATVLTLDNVNYLSPPDPLLWIPGSIHTMTVPDIVNADSGTRYVFIGWNDDNTSATRAVSKGSYVANYGLEYLLTVTSPYGETTGTGWYSSGTIIDFSVTSSIETTYTRRYFTGWSGDFTGTSPTDSLIMDAPKTVTADWRTEHLLILESEYGNPLGAGWYDEGASVNISIEYDKGFLVRQIFDGWSGDYTSAEVSTMVTMGSPKFVIAAWHTDYFWTYIIVAIVVFVVAVVTFLIIRFRVFRRLFPRPPKPRQVRVYRPSPPRSRLNK
jgi:hypothetical protein